VEVRVRATLSKFRPNLTWKRENAARGGEERQYEEAGGRDEVFAFSVSIFSGEKNIDFFSFVVDCRGG